MAKEAIVEKENILRILREARAAVSKEDVVKIKSLSNQTIHSASVEQDADSIAIAVIIYSLSKIIERKSYVEYKEWPSFYKEYINLIDLALKNLEKDNYEEFRKNINQIREEISALSGRFKDYIQDVFRKAEINKASKIYEHGISLEQTAGLLGITLWELAEYSGQTGLSDIDLSVTLPIKQRIKNAEDMFKR